jgi:hypothetical protein
MGIHRFVNLNLYTNRSGNDATSEFGKNYKDYGYELDSQGKWSSPTMTEDKSARLCSYFNMHTDKTNKLACWHLFDLINCGVLIKQGKELMLKEKDHFKINFIDFLNTYKSKLKSL